MKLRVLLSLLFIIVSTFSAVHELEHIEDQHSGSSCLVCTLAHNLVSPDNDFDLLSLELEYEKEIQSTHGSSNIDSKKNDNHSHAPPRLS